MSRACRRSGRFLYRRVGLGASSSEINPGPFAVGLPRGPFELQGALGSKRRWLSLSSLSLPSPRRVSPYGHHQKNDLELALTRGIRLSN